MAYRKIINLIKKNKGGYHQIPCLFPTTRNEGGYHQMPYLPRKDGWRPSAPPEPAQSQPSARSTTPATQNEAQCHKHRTYHAKSRWMYPSTIPVMRNKGKMKVDNIKHRTYHAMRRWMSPNVPPVTRNKAGCRQVPGLPRKIRLYRRQFFFILLFVF